MRVAVVLGLLLLALAGPGTAAAAKPPCWKTLINDWYDTTIDGTYPIPCYQQAIDHLPTDAQLYSSAKDDILRAMARADRAAEAGDDADHDRRRPDDHAPRPTTTAATTTAAAVDDDDRADDHAARGRPAGDDDEPGPPEAEGRRARARQAEPRRCDSFPLPLLILGALAILLVAAGIVGMIWRRMDRDGGDTGAGPA